MRRGMGSWSLLNAYAALMLSFFPYRRIEGIGWWTDFALLLSCLLQFFFASAILKVPLRLPVAGVLTALFMVWGATTTLLAHGDLGRSLYAPIAFYNIWGLLYVTLYASVQIGIYLSPGIRKLIVVPWLGLLAFSGIVAFAQLAGQSWAFSLSDSGAVGEGFRPVGITDYSFMLGVQGVIGALLIGTRLYNRELRVWEWGGVGFFILVILIAQYRSLYYAGILVIGAFLLYYQFRHNRSRGVLLLVASLGLIFVPLLLFPQKLAYGMRGAANDPALEARYQSWQQLGPVLKIRPWTGIGGDQSLMISSGIANLDKYSGTVIDNFYRMVLICYGYVGMMLLIPLLFALVIGLFMRLDQTRSGQVKSYTLGGIVLMASLLVVSLTGNSFVYRPVGYELVLFLVLGSPSWDERRRDEIVSPFTAWVRMVAHSPLRTLFPGFSRVR